MNELSYIIETDLSNDVRSAISLLKQAVDLLKPHEKEDSHLKEEFSTEDSFGDNNNNNNNNSSNKKSSSYTKATLELDGCLLRKAKVETKFVLNSTPSTSSSASSSIISFLKPNSNSFTMHELSTHSNHSANRDDYYYDANDVNEMTTAAAGGAIATASVTTNTTTTTTHKGSFGFTTELATNLGTPWVLEQALSTRKSTQQAIECLLTIQKKITEFDFDLKSLHAYLSETIQLAVQGRNYFFLPNSLGFPQTLRPFNGFSPPLGKDFHLEFYIFRSRLIISSYYFVPCTTPSNSPINNNTNNGRGTKLDTWFDDANHRLIDTNVQVGPNRFVTVKAENTVSFVVAHFAKTISLLQECIDILNNTSQNILALLAERASNNVMMMPVSDSNATTWI